MIIKSLKTFFLLNKKLYGLRKFFLGFFYSEKHDENDGAATWKVGKLKYAKDL